MQLSRVLDYTGIKPAARYVVFRCYDAIGDTLSGPTLLPSGYYESIDLIGARHPQTILAYGLNGDTLAIANGAPRIEQQLGYKMAKYIRTIEIFDSFAKIVVATAVIGRTETTTGIGFVKSLL